MLLKQNRLSIINATCHIAIILSLLLPRFTAKDKKEDETKILCIFHQKFFANMLK